MRRMSSQSAPEKKEEVVVMKFRELEETIEEENIYSEDYRERLLDDDEITPWESGFMQGWEEAVQGD